MVVTFYTLILKDKTVAPFFIERLGDNLGTFLWKAHIELLTNFWTSIALGDTAYRGNPFAPHTRLHGLKRETFDQWLILFFGVVDGIYTPEVASQFKERSTIIAGNFMRNLHL
jgi:hemoglobin